MMPLTLRRRPGETITIDGPAEILVLEVTRKHVVVSITAAPDVTILRGELAGHLPMRKVNGKWRPIGEDQP